MIPATWNKAHIGELCQMVKGKTPIMKTKPGNYPLVTMGEEHKTADKYELDAEAVCVPMISSFGHGKPGLKRVHYIKGKFALSNILMALIVKEPHELSTKYLALYLQTFKDQLIVPLQTGAANMSLRPEKLAGVPVYYPTLKDQKRIVHLLDEAESMQAARLQANELIRRFVPAIFKEMFGEMLGENLKYPKIRFGDVITTIDFGISQALSNGAEYRPGRIPILRIANITGKGTVDYSDLRYIDLSETRKAKFSLQKGDLLFNWRNSPNWVGKTAIFDEDEEFTFASFLFRVKLDNNRADNTYIWFYLNHLRHLGFFEAICRQAVSQANFGRHELAKVDIMLPPLVLQREFASRAREVRAVEEMQKKIEERIDALRKSMLARAFAGEL